MNKPTFIFRTVSNKDFPSLARLRAGSQDQITFWEERISQYMAGTHNPQKSLSQRVIYVAESNNISDNIIVGFIAGQLTTRYSCQGEVQWLDVTLDFRRNNLASKLVETLAEWFVQKQAYKVCVDPGNDVARLFYAAIGATDLNAHWMYWEDIRKVFAK